MSEQAINTLRHILNSPELATDRAYRDQIQSIIDAGSSDAQDTALLVAQRMSPTGDAFDADPTGEWRATIARVIQEKAQ